MKPTPETDAFVIKFKTPCGEKYWVPVDISRKLERERDILRRWTTVNGVIELERELDEARGQRDRLTDRAADSGCRVSSCSALYRIWYDDGTSVLAHGTTTKENLESEQHRQSRPCIAIPVNPK